MRLMWASAKEHWRPLIGREKRRRLLRFPIWESDGTSFRIGARRATPAKARWRPLSAARLPKAGHSLQFGRQRLRRPSGERPRPGQALDVFDQRRLL